MIVRCPDCNASYEVSTGPLPEPGVRVRCPRCKAVFQIRPRNAAEDPARAPAPAPSSTLGNGTAVLLETVTASMTVRGLDADAAGDSPDADDPGAGEAEETYETEGEAEEAEIGDGEEEPEGAPVPEPDRPRRPPRPVRDPVVARRMARAMVQEMILGRQTELAAARASGTLLAVFGTQITRAGRAYHERIAAELPEAGRYFRDAVNDILGAGKPLI